MIQARPSSAWKLVNTRTSLAIRKRSAFTVCLTQPTSVTTASEQQAESKPDVLQQSRKIASPRVHRNQPVHSFEAAAVPKLDRFPSSQPLSEQERLLLAYLNQTPKEEVVLAIAKTKSNEDLRVKDLEIQSLENETTSFGIE